ncbi:hypothetical protein HUU59_11020 [bacterium]|nr:hypothetical protein [bacterium]
MSDKSKDPKFSHEASEALQQYMAEVHNPPLDFTDPNDIAKAAEDLLILASAEPQKATVELTEEEATAKADAQLKRDFCGILKALQEDTRSAGEKQNLIKHALARFS